MFNIHYNHVRYRLAHPSVDTDLLNNMIVSYRHLVYFYLQKKIEGQKILIPQIHGDEKCVLSSRVKIKHTLRHIF